MPSLDSTSLLTTQQVANRFSFSTGRVVFVSAIIRPTTEQTHYPDLVYLIDNEEIHLWRVTCHELAV
jgi:hypothetical protein